MNGSWLPLLLGRVDVDDGDGDVVAPAARDREVDRRRATVESARAPAPGPTSRASSSARRARSSRARRSRDQPPGPSGTEASRSAAGSSGASAPTQRVIAWARGRRAPLGDAACRRRPALRPRVVDGELAGVVVASQYARLSPIQPTTISPPSHSRGDERARRRASAARPCHGTRSTALAARRSIGRDGSPRSSAPRRGRCSEHAARGVGGAAARRGRPRPRSRCRRRRPRPRRPRRRRAKASSLR